MPQIKENFFENILFRFESCSCDCAEDIVHIAPDEEPDRQYKLQAVPAKPLVFAYAAKRGLVRIAPNGTIEESNILGRLISLPNKPMSEMARFLKENGFLFPVRSGGYEKFDAAEVYYIINRLRLTVELMTATNEIHKDYDKIVNLTLSLLFSGDVKIKTDMMEREYVTCHHPYIDILQMADFNVSYVRRQEEFNADYYVVNDCLFGTFKLSTQEYNDIKSGYSMEPGFREPVFRSVAALYLNLDGTPMERKITDFLFHYFHEVGMVDFSNGMDYFSAPKEENFTDKMKEVLLEIANFIVGEEINANLDGIHPVYDAKKMMPSWKVDSLLCAAYFSIFYLKPDLELYRPCDNPKCGKYFLVRTTTTKIRFCSTECCNCVTQARYRKKKREKESR